MTAPMRMVLALILALSAAPARAEPLVADLSDDVIAITTGFTGSDVLLFGATEGEGDVIVVVRGPMGPQVVRRKTRQARSVDLTKADIVERNYQKVGFSKK